MNAPSNIPANPPTVLEAHRRAQRIMREARATERLIELGKAATYLAEVRNNANSPLDKTLLWAEFHFTKALKNHHGEDVDDAFQIACENLNVDEYGDPVVDPDDYDEFSRGSRRSTWGMGA